MKQNWNIFGEKNFLNSEKIFFNEEKIFTEKINIFFRDLPWSSVKWANSIAWNKENEKNEDKKDIKKEKIKIKNETSRQLENTKYIIKLKQIQNTWFKTLENSLRDDINMQSFHETFKKISTKEGWAEKVLEKIKKLKPEEKSNLDIINNFNSEDDYWFSNEDEKSFSDIRELFEKNWYQTKNFLLHNSEWEAIYQLVESFVKNWKILDNQKEWEKILDKNSWKIKKFNNFENFLFDFDEWVNISNSKIEWISESEIKDLTNEKNYQVLIQNLWLLAEWGLITDFNKEIFTNPNLKNEFHQRLILMLWTLHNT